MFELLLKEGLGADEDIKIKLVKAKAGADDGRYSAEMCPQPAELLDALDLRPKRKRCRVKMRPPVARRVLPAMPRPREHRAAPRRTGAARADRAASADDGGSSSDPPPRLKSECGPRAAVIPARSRAPRVLKHGRARR